MAVPASVRKAWGITGEIEHLEGGQGTSFRAGDLVLKPQPDEDVVIWHAQLCDHVVPTAFRLPAPVRAADGRLVVDGWYATEFVQGSPIPQGNGSTYSWLEVIACARAFHAAVSNQPPPRSLTTRTDPWAVADRAAWGEGDPDVIGARAQTILQGLRKLLVTESLPHQVIHGDLAGNVLHYQGLPPAVIDLSPYWRPSEYADAIVVIDALLWWDADLTLMSAARLQPLSPETWTSLLARALIFRLLAFDVTRPTSDDLNDQLPRYTRVLSHLTMAH